MLTAGSGSCCERDDRRASGGNWELTMLTQEDPTRPSLRVSQCKDAPCETGSGTISPGDGQLG
jgi:hypothetical protein